LPRSPPLRSTQVPQLQRVLEDYSLDSLLGFFGR
jgi:hypothetical protein